MSDLRDRLAEEICDRIPGLTCMRREPMALPCTAENCHSVQAADAVLVTLSRHLAFETAQLRHAYHHMLEGRPGPGSHKEFANGLLAPAIRRLEEI